MSKITYATSEDLLTSGGGGSFPEEYKNKIDGMMIKSYSVLEADWSTDTYNGSQVYSYTLNHGLGTSNLTISYLDSDTRMNMGVASYQVIDSNSVKLYVLEKLNAKFIITASK